MNKKGKIYGSSVLIIVMLMAVFGFVIELGIEEPTGAFDVKSKRWRWSPKKFIDRTKRVGKTALDRVRSPRRVSRRFRKSDFEPTFCKDSDGPNNYLKKGTTQNNFYKHQDFCDGKDLIEYYCDKKKNAALKRINCKTIGKTKCSNGMCV